VEIEGCRRANWRRGVAGVIFRSEDLILYGSREELLRCAVCDASSRYLAGLSSNEEKLVSS
jgi:hypothetical protein